MAFYSSGMLAIWIVSSPVLSAGASAVLCTTIDCVGTRGQVQPNDLPDQLRGMLVIEGMGERCFLSLEAGGRVLVQPCRVDEDTGLSRVTNWRWAPPGLWLLDMTGASVFILSKDPSSLVFRQRMSDGRSVLFYPFAAEAVRRPEG